MNILVSYNWLKEYLPSIKANPEEVAEKLSLHAFSVERIWKMNEFLDRVVVGKILRVSKHPDADRLQIVEVESNGSHTVVCGGTNLKVGMLVALALPGAKVKWHGEGDLVTLEETKVRGVKSEGMICAGDEIGLNNVFNHGKGEILDLSSLGIKVGIPISKALDLDDTIMEIEITSNRPDASGMIGIAREVSAIFNVKSEIDGKKVKIQKGTGLSVKVEDPKLCPRYIAISMEDIKVKDSPWWLQRKLIAAGVHPINNIVDITNYVLLEYGQPCHAFDADKLDKGLVVRKAKKGEKILALNENTYELSENILVIADSKKPVAIAGIMGGEQTGVRKGTSKIVYEIATFDPVIVRKGEHELALNSDSSIRFNKGLPVELPQYAANKLLDLTKKIAGGKIVAVVDKKAGMQKNVKVAVDPKEVQKIVGVDIPLKQMRGYLTKLGFKISGTSKWSIGFPYWRVIEADGIEDVAEEVARMYGYHLLPSILPVGSPSDEVTNLEFVKESTVKHALRGAGYTEIYTYSFISKDELDAADFDDAVRISNPLTSDFEYMRPWLGISMLSAISKNQASRDKLNLFELSNEYIPANGLPKDRQKLIVAIAGKESNDGEHFFNAKGVAEYLENILSLPKVSFEKVASQGKSPWVKHYHPGRVLVCKSNNDILGIVGEIHPALRSKFDIDARVAFLEWEFSAMVPLIGKGIVYNSPLSHPPVKRDISFIISNEFEYKDVIDAIDNIDTLVYKVELFDRYSGKGIQDGHQSLAFHISYADPGRTLTSEEADGTHNRLIKKLEKTFKIQIR